jgi:hypothetical protein
MKHNESITIVVLGEDQLREGAPIQRLKIGAVESGWAKLDEL